MAAGRNIRAQHGGFIDGCISKNDGMECWNGWLPHAMMCNSG